MSWRAFSQISLGDQLLAGRLRLVIASLFCRVFGGTWPGALTSNQPSTDFVDPILHDGGDETPKVGKRLDLILIDPLAQPTSDRQTDIHGVHSAPKRRMPEPCAHRSQNLGFVASPEFVAGGSVPRLKAMKQRKKGLFVRS